MSNDKLHAVLTATLLGGALTGFAGAQQTGPVTPADTFGGNQSTSAKIVATGVVAGGAPSGTDSERPQPFRSTYVLGPQDQFSIQALEADELSGKMFRIDGDGNIRLPLAGTIKASGLTIQQLESEIAKSLRKYIKEPDVAVSITEFRSQPISIIGSVKSPGVQQLQGRKTLIECLALAGGPTEDAGYNVTITRRLEWGPIPLPSAESDPSGTFSVANVSLEAIMAGSEPTENIVVFPEDVISIPHADMVYVVGTVEHPGGFILRERKSVSILQALSLAGGTSAFAAPQKAFILRTVPGEVNRREIPVNLKTMLAGKSGDVPLLPNDILFVPSSTGKKVLARTAEAAIQIGTLSIYRF